MVKKKDDLDFEEAFATPLVEEESADLSPAEKLQLEAEAKAEVTKELKAEKKKEYKESKKKELKRKALFSEGKDERGADTVTVTLNLAASHPNICVDGRKYYHGRTYTVSKALAAVFADQQYRGWLHEDEIGGKSMNEFFGRQKNRMSVGAAGVRFN